MERGFFARFREWWLVALIAFLIGQIPSWYPIASDWFRPIFVVRALSSLQGDSVFSRYFQGPAGWDKEDFDVALFVQVVNNDDTPLQIEGYAVEAKTARGWISYRRIEVLDGLSVKFIQGGEPPRGYIDMTPNGFDILAQSRVIDPGHSIEGWMFFAWPSEVDSASPAKPATGFRITLLDSKGRVSRVRAAAPKGDVSSITKANFKVLPKSSPPPWAAMADTPPSSGAP